MTVTEGVSSNPGHLGLVWHPIDLIFIINVGQNMRRLTRTYQVLRSINHLKRFYGNRIDSNRNSFDSERSKLEGKLVDNESRYRFNATLI